MKTGLKRTLIITGSIAGALILTIIILSAIIVKPLKDFMKADYSVQVMVSPIAAQNGAYESEIKDKLDSVRFSVMRSLLEFNSDYGIKAVTKKVDGEKEHERYSASSFMALAPKAEQYMLKFSYKSVQTNDRFTDGDGKLIKFDTLIVLINKSNDRIQPVTMYPYLRGNLSNSYVDGEGNPLDTADENGRINSAYYYVYEFSAKMYTSTVYDFLVEKEFIAGLAQAA